jgi:hypothetical protein
MYFLHRLRNHNQLVPSHLGQTHHDRTHTLARIYCMGLLRTTEALGFHYMDPIVGDPLLTRVYIYAIVGLSSLPANLEIALMNWTALSPLARVCTDKYN